MSLAFLPTSFATDLVKLSTGSTSAERISVMRSFTGSQSVSVRMPVSGSYSKNSDMKGFEFLCQVNDEREREQTLVLALPVVLRWGLWPFTHRSIEALAGI